MHVHDGEVRPKAHFDLTLDAQFGDPGLEPTDWEASDGALGAVVDAERAKLIDPHAGCWRRFFRGSLENRDVTL